MSISTDEPLTGDNPTVAQEPYKWQETILTNAFDEQIKLVEKSVNAAKNDGAKEKKKNGKKAEVKTKGQNSKTPATQNFQTKHEKHVYTNRSKIYRFNETEGEETLPPSTIHLPQPLHPPTDISVDLTRDMDSESETRASMLTSWYMAGYHTGYYDAMKKYKKDLN